MFLISLYISAQVTTQPPQWAFEGRWLRCNCWDLPDLDQDGDVDVDDYAAWQEAAGDWPRPVWTIPSCDRADIIHNGWVDHGDLLVILTWWGKGIPGNNLPLPYDPVAYYDWVCLDPGWDG